MKISRNALCLLVAGTLFHAQFYAASVSADTTTTGTPRVRQTRIAQRARPGGTRSRRISAAVRAMLSGSVSRTDRLMRNDPTTGETLTNQARGPDSIPAGEPAQAGTGATAAITTAAVATTQSDRSHGRVYTPTFSTKAGSNDHVAAIRGRAGFSEPSASDAARAAADDPNALLLIGPEQREQIIRSARRVLPRGQRALSVRADYVRGDGVELRFQGGRTFTIPRGNIRFPAEAELPQAVGLGILKQEVTRAAEDWLSEVGLLEPENREPPEALLQIASRDDIQEATNIRSNGLIDPSVASIAGRIAANRRTLLLTKRTFAASLAAELTQLGVGADNIVSIDSLTSASNRAGTYRFVRVTFVKDYFVKDYHAQSITRTVPESEVLFGNVLNRRFDTPSVDGAIESELTQAVTEYLSDPTARIATVEDGANDSRRAPAAPATRQAQ